MTPDAPRPPRDDIRCDVCVIGAGPAGITIARELNGTEIAVCLVESGAENVSARVQRQSRGDSDGYSIHRLHTSRVRAFGGTMRHRDFDSEEWTARPLDAPDFEDRPNAAHPGWPFGQKELDPYYRRAQAAAELGPYDYSAEHFFDPATTPILDLGASAEVETTMFHYGPPVFHHALPDLQTSANVRLLLRTRVVDMRTGPAGGIDTALARHQDGSEVSISARIFVLATGAIENARMLLTANERRGVGNDHDLVGRFFAERLSFHAGHIVADDPALTDRCAFYGIHRARGSSVRGVLRVRDEVQRAENLRNCLFFVLPRPVAVTTDGVRSLATLRKAVSRRPLPERTGSHVRNVVRGVADIGSLATCRLRPAQNRLIVRAQAEPAPARDSRVSLGRRCDDLGVPRATLHWSIEESGFDSVIRSLDVVDRAVRAAGIGHLVKAVDHDRPMPLMEGNHHHLGTTRMHVDPRQGVVDPDCRVHSVPNLYVAGSSVFPTYGASNPTLTIVALAIRLADHLRALARRPGATVGLL